MRKFESQCAVIYGSKYLDATEELRRLPHPNFVHQGEFVNRICGVGE
jgi:hypothetical protein